MTSRGLAFDPALDFHAGSGLSTLRCARFEHSNGVFGFLIARRATRSTIQGLQA